MDRFAVIDIGTNSVLLLVAERGRDGKFKAIKERAEITRLGRGVDKARKLNEQAMEDTLQVLVEFSREARELGAQRIAVSATSAARDASNGEKFLTAAQQRAGVEVEIISGDREAQLSFTAVFADFSSLGRPLVVLDIGGGSTEFIYAEKGKTTFSFRHSFEVGSVRMTERFVHSDPPSAQEQLALREHLKNTFSHLPSPPSGFQAVGVAGTVTTLFALLHAIEPYDAASVHGKRLAAEEVSTLVRTLCATPVDERRRMKGLNPKRADVIPAGAMILEAVLQQLSAEDCLVSDRGLRWGLLQDRFA